MKVKENLEICIDCAMYIAANELPTDKERAAQVKKSCRRKHLGVTSELGVGRFACDLCEAYDETYRYEAVELE